MALDFLREYKYLNFNVRNIRGECVVVNIQEGLIIIGGAEDKTAEKKYLQRYVPILIR